MFPKKNSKGSREKHIVAFKLMVEDFLEGNHSPESFDANLIWEQNDHFYSSAMVKSTFLRKPKLAAKAAIQMKHKGKFATVLPALPPLLPSLY